MNLTKKLGAGFLVLALILGIFLIVRLVMNIELVVGFLTITFGLVAIIWTLKAKNSLSKGSTIRAYATNFLVALTCLLTYSIWRVILVLFFIDSRALIIEYFFITITYLVFVSAAYRILYLSEEFGFSEQVKEIKRLKKRR